MVWRELGWPLDADKLTTAQRQKLNRLHKLVDHNWHPRDQKAAQRLSVAREAVRSTLQELVDITPPDEDELCALLADQRYEQQWLRAYVGGLRAFEALNTACRETGLDIRVLAEDDFDAAGRRYRAQRDLAVVGYRAAIEPTTERDAGFDDIQAIMEEPPHELHGHGRRGGCANRLVDHGLPSLPENFLLEGRGQACHCGLPTDTSRCLIHRRVVPGLDSVEQAAERATRTNGKSTKNIKHWPPGWNIGDHSRRCTAGTSPSIYARPGDRPQPWHPRVRPTNLPDPLRGP